MPVSLSLPSSLTDAIARALKTFVQTLVAVLGANAAGTSVLPGTITLVDGLKLAGLAALASLAQNLTTKAVTPAPAPAAVVPAVLAGLLTPTAIPADPANVAEFYRGSAPVNPFTPERGQVPPATVDPAPATPEAPVAAPDPALAGGAPLIDPAAPVA